MQDFRLMRWWLFLHLIGVLGLTLSHGTSVATAFRLRKEREPPRIKTLLELSYMWVGVVHMAMFLVIITGVVLGFLTHAWSRGWIWTSLGLLIGLWIAMSALGTRYYDRVRRGVGAEPFYGAKKEQPPVTELELKALLESRRPWLLATLGLGTLLVILWLMIFRPF